MGMKLHFIHPCLVGLACLLISLPAAAQYKVIEPDGRITYTDRPIPAAGARITPLRRDSPAIEVPAAALPAVLRQLAARYPVTLYSSAECSPCDSGRQLLQQRGVPYTEKRIVSESDATALEAATGSRTLPTLSVGSQALRGMSPTDWAAYLDAAGYPKESRLPKDWQAPAVTTLTERPVAPAPQPAAPVAVASPGLPAAPPAPGKVRF